MKIMIKELGEIITGSTPSKKTEEFWNSDDICFVKPDIIPDNGVNIISESNEYISEDARKKARVVTKDAIFVTCIGSIGKIGIASDREFAFNQQINAIVTNKKVNSKYLAYNLLFNKPRLVAIANAPVVPIINKSQFGEFPVKIESDVNKQSEIVGGLERLSHIIERRTKELSALDTLIKARFVEMFGDPILNPNGYLKEKTEKHIDLLSGYPFKSEQYVEEGINICGGLIITPQKIKWNECVHWSSAEGFEDYLLNENDIVMALDRPWISEGFKVAKVDAEHLPALLIQRTARIRAIDMNQEYLYYCFINGGFDKHSNVTGSLVPHISAKDIRSFEIMIPPAELQNQFADFAHQVDKSKFVLQKKFKIIHYSDII